ncbi:U3 snoRNP-associated protein Esf2 [Cordyceps fumosorosea ARSEF 2679]|uniref:18S rRNA factor 2 n=1 Tax=Cordyceps fumosorosea (strain ARSEF 2679) TaxID=1081104 RepID=A0A167UF09_CORFA|nr:U3 snoRNP-associated protein Esf2 [Cordyceps fumosorosea ARSEF 2679]OAA61521.1 U3 snoRNP-associated protein Esf2 [Cordyceps fumosorosea ARSEF 2679]
MAPNANDFLDASESENDHIDIYDSEDEFAKGGSRSTKRRKPSRDDDDSEQARSDADHDGGSDDDEDDDGDDDAKSTQGEEQPTKKQTKLPKLQADLPNVSRPLARKNLVATEKAVKKSGVAYLSRIPPFMKPAKLRSLLEPYGAINRIFLAPEDAAAHARRVRAGGNKKRTYTEGWVEFINKKDAKDACALLNARTVGGKKGSYYRDDLWNLLYLRGFKWRDLTGQIAAEDAERASRMRAEIGRASRENKEFARNVEQGKAMEGIARTAAARKRKAGDEEGGGGAQEEEGEEDGQETRKKQRNTRTFKQIPLAKKQNDTEEQPERVTRVLSSIF